MPADFAQVEWNEQLIDDCRQLVRLAVREDLDRTHDWTTLALVSQSQRASASLVAREDGTLAGLRAAEVVLAEMQARLELVSVRIDGDRIEAGCTVATISGFARHLLTAERLVLNLVARMSGIATLTDRYVRQVRDTRAAIYDTRKTTPGWRRLEKYAVRCGGGRNHRTGLFDAVLIKDNHLAAAGIDPAEAVQRARRFVLQSAPSGDEMIVEVEVDTIEQLHDVLPAHPDIVLLDNMTPAQLVKAVQLRDSINGAVQLEASGGIDLSTVKSVARTGVDRISVGALTHGATSLDIGLDWISQ